MALSIPLLPADTVPLVSTFLFVFAVFFGLLTYSKVGNFDRKINGAIALAVAFFAIMYQPLVDGLTQWMPIAIAIMIPVFFIIFLKKVFEGGKPLETFPLLVSLAILLALLMIFQNYLRPYIPTGIDPSAFLWIIGIVIAGMFFWLVYKTPNQ